MVVDTISSVRSSTLLRVLLDSGSTTSLCFKRCLPKNCKPQEIASSRKVNTLSEPYTSTEVVIMCNLRLPEFDKNRNINKQKALVFQSETCKYDIILGADFLTKIRHWCQIQHKNHRMVWQCVTIVLPSPSSNKEFEAIAEIIKAHQEEELFGMDWYDPTCYATEILDTKYEKIELMR